MVFTLFQNILKTMITFLQDEATAITTCSRWTALNLGIMVIQMVIAVKEVMHNDR